MEQLALAGASGVAFDRQPPAQAGQLPQNWEYRAGNVCSEADVGAATRLAVELHGRLDAVVANAGITAPWVETSEIRLEDWRRTFAVNVEGVAITLKLAARRMLGGGGSIVAIGSLNSWQGHPRQAAYVASKHAVLGLVRSAALDLGKFGIRVNALAPDRLRRRPFSGELRIGRSKADRIPSRFCEKWRKPRRLEEPPASPKSRRLACSFRAIWLAESPDSCFRSMRACRSLAGAASY